MSHGVIGRSRSSQPLGLLKKEKMKITAGRKIAYVVDCILSDANVEKIAVSVVNPMQPPHRDKKAAAAKTIDNAISIG
jgi:hypothetical protein